MASLRLLAVLVLVANTASAVDVREKYEEQLVQSAMLAHGLTPEPDPEGKLIEDIVIHENDVLHSHDLTLLNKVPLLSRFRALNKLHVLTRKYIIRQELLFATGQHVSHDVLEETGRNLRSMFILAVARIVVCRGSQPDRVVILVVTKDNWTLRLNTNFFFDQARIDTLSFSISENNLAGRNKTVSFNFAFDPGRYAVGLGYSDPRIWSSRHSATVQAGIYVGRDTGAYEGFLASVSVGRPLFSLRSRWAWTLSGSWFTDIYRDFREGALRAVKIGDEVIPLSWSRREALLDLNMTRSWGLRNKLNLTWGWRIGSTLYTPLPQYTSGVSPSAMSVYQRYVMPRSEDASGPYMIFSAYSARYVRMQNINTFALSEDFRIGPSVSLEARWADEIFGLGKRYLSFSAKYSDGRWIRGGWYAISASAGARVQDGVWAGSLLVNQDVQLAARHITPKFGPFRLHVYFASEFRAHDLFHSTLTLGGDNGLRSFPARAFPFSASTGSSARYQVNVELRSLALNLWSVHVGGVLFYDGGDAPLSLLTAGWHHGAGVGLRILLPQFNHDVIRLDLGFPFETYAGVWSPRFTASFGQAF